jgi:hypothetical protein
MQDWATKPALADVGAAELAVEVSRLDESEPIVVEALHADYSSAAVALVSDLAASEPTPLQPTSATSGAAIPSTPPVRYSGGAILLEEAVDSAPGPSFKTFAEGEREAMLAKVHSEAVEYAKVRKLFRQAEIGLRAIPRPGRAPRPSTNSRTRGSRRRGATTCRTAGRAASRGDPPDDPEPASGRLLTRRGSSHPRANRRGGR